MARALDEMGVPVTLVLDSGVAYCMGRCAAVHPPSLNAHQPPFACRNVPFNIVTAAAGTNLLCCS